MVLMIPPNSDNWVSVASYENLPGCLQPMAAARLTA